MSRFATISLSLLATLCAARAAHAQAYELDPSGTPPPAELPDPSSDTAASTGATTGAAGDGDDGAAPSATGAAPAPKGAGGDGAGPSEGFYYTEGAGTDRGGGVADDVGVAYRGPTPEVHVVKKGDTLWDLSGYYFNNSWEWPKVWSYNEKITNPHWIYPGDLVRLMPVGATGPGPALALTQVPLTGPAPLAQEGAAAPAGVELRR
jgi:nucleoid-associated protein YgaU